MNRFISNNLFQILAIGLILVIPLGILIFSYWESEMEHEEAMDKIKFKTDSLQVILKEGEMK